MITTMNIHGCRDICVDRYSHSVNALFFAFIGDDGARHETTAYGIKPATAIKIMAALGTPTTYIHYRDKTLTLDQYIEELSIQEVLEKMGASDAA